MTEEKTKEEIFVEKHGWKKVKGYKLDLERVREMPDDWDNCYFEKEDLDDYITETEFWKHEDWEESAFEDIDDLIDFIEENSEDKFEESDEL